MASGPVSRTDRPNTWLLRPALRRERTLDSPEPSTQAVHTWPLAASAHLADSDGGADITSRLPNQRQSKLVDDRFLCTTTTNDPFALDTLTGHCLRG
jgi:hypothetical protein